MLYDTLILRCGLRTRNRLWLAPMTNRQSHADGSLSDDELHWLERRAAGGFGVIETCASHVSRDGQGWPGELGVFDDALLPGLSRLASAIASQGAAGIVQIFHGGLRAPAALIGQTPWSATAFAAPGLEPARAATEADIERVIGDFAAAAARAHRAGFAGVELHGAHGYLLGQFLSATINTRADGWGGSLEGRARLVREATRAARAAVPKSFAVGVRLSPEDRGNAVGLDLDESIQVARWLADEGVDFVHLSLWDAAQNTRKRPEEHPLPLFRRALPAEVAIVVAGGVWTQAQAEALLQKGASAVALGLAGIANPEWPTRSREAGWEPRRPPLTIAELRGLGLNETFAQAMRGWKGFVADAG
jgi:2,4-dienoyl-CoA reductase-like NADH-dependent reductase (Old Yellow Enzyme family)